MILNLRPAEADEEEKVVSLWKTCGLVTSYNDPAHDFRAARAKPNSDILLALDDKSQLLGSIMVGHDGHRGWVYYVASHPEHRLKSIGRQLIDAGEAWLCDRGIVKVMLLVRDTNTAVVDFYKRFDFEAIPRVVMQKWLIK